MLNFDYDVIVIGSGPGGYVAAIRAAQLGLKVAVVEEAKLGGVCLNWGCIPTKALLRSAEVLTMAKECDRFGVEVSKIGYDFSKILARSRAVADKLGAGVGGLLSRNGVEIVYGFGSMIDVNTIKIKSEALESILKAKYFIIASGARPRVLAGYEPDGDLVWTYREAMHPKEKKPPKSLTIVGAGAIGMEFAAFYNALGTKVTVLESMARILNTEDMEISEMATKQFIKQGMTIHSGVELKSMEKSSNQVHINAVVNGITTVISSERVLMSIGIVPNSEQMNLESMGIKLDRGRVVIDGYAKTSLANIYAIGDVAVSVPFLAHKASHEGIIAAEHIATSLGKFDAKKIHPIKRENVPGCIYTSPQIASVGITEEQAKKAGMKVKVGRFSAIGNGKAIAMGEEFGLVKVIFNDETGELLGAHLIGAEVTEMIQGFVIAKQAELTEEDLMATVFPHPTMSEMMHESVLSAFDRAIHK